MNRFQTAASRAEEKVREMLPPEAKLLKPWQLINHEPITATLKCTHSEIMELFYTEAVNRPGFSVDERKVIIPSLFVKLSGMFKHLKLPTSNITKKTSKKGLVFESIMDFMRHDSCSIQSDELLALLNEQGLISKESLYRSQYYNYGFLRREYQDILIDNINYLLHNRLLIFPYSQIPGTRELLSALLNIDYKILMLFQDFDFQQDVPFVIIHNEDCQSFSDRQAYVLALLNLLGFDIVISSTKGYADIENHVCKDVIDIHYSNVGRDGMLKRLFKRITKPVQPRLNKFVIALLAVLIGIVLSSQLASHLLSQISSGTTLRNLPIVDRNDVAEGIDIGIGNVVTFMDGELEKKIRMIIGRSKGPIYDTELLKIKQIEIFGELVEKNSFARGGSLGSKAEDMWYEDKYGNRYTERSRIKSLEDLKWFKNLEEVIIVYNSIEDISVLAEIKNLKYVNLSNNFITDISALGKLDELQSVILDNNSIKEITPLKGLKYVRQLGLENNKISNINSLKDYKVIELLNLNRNNIKDISPVRNLVTLKFLYFTQNLVKDINPVSGLNSLERLLIDGNPIEDYSVLEKLKNTEVYR